EKRCELAEIIAGLLLATPVTFTVLCDVRLGLLPHENIAVILFNSTKRWALLKKEADNFVETPDAIKWNVWHKS
ncbi:MAG: hypothetical protein WAM14_10155, partial [Candidatus Nitrosopolaris sp.]